MFQPTQEMITACAEVLAREVIVDAVFQITEEYNREILNGLVLRKTIYLRHPSRRMGEDVASERIHDPASVYLCADADKLNEYYRLSKLKRDELGLKVPDPEQDPEMVAACNLRHAKTALLKSMIPVVKQDLSTLCGSKRTKALGLAISMLLPFTPEDLALKRIHDLATEAGLYGPALYDKVVTLKLS